MNFKRGAIEKFIEKDLIKGVSAALDTGALADQADVVEQIKELAEQIGESLGDDAIDGDGDLAAKYHDTKAGRKYLAFQAKARGAQARPAVEAAVFNHLYSFFSRYYDAGDFISKRKYSERRNFYAVPYNGEEVYLHWANKDQYYGQCTGYAGHDNRRDDRLRLCGLHVQHRHVRRDGSPVLRLPQRRGKPRLVRAI
jgi:adenine-specific DNA-methyltransferase